jgi:hypothetical protein
MSPTVLRDGPYRVFFFSSDGAEPAHVHVTRERRTAKIWLEPVTVANSGGFAQNELNKIVRLVQDHQTELLKAWHDFFKSGGGNGEAGSRH